MEVTQMLERVEDIFDKIKKELNGVKEACKDVKAMEARVNRKIKERIQQNKLVNTPNNPSAVLFHLQNFLKGKVRCWEVRLELKAIRSLTEQVIQNVEDFLDAFDEAEHEQQDILEFLLDSEELLESNWYNLLDQWEILNLLAQSLHELDISYPSVNIFGSE